MSGFQNYKINKYKYKKKKKEKEEKKAKGNQLFKLMWLYSFQHHRATVLKIKQPTSSLIYTEYVILMCTFLSLWYLLGNHRKKKTRHEPVTLTSQHLFRVRADKADSALNYLHVCLVHMGVTFSQIQLTKQQHQLQIPA